MTSKYDNAEQDSHQRNSGYGTGTKGPPNSLTPGTIGRAYNEDVLIRIPTTRSLRTCRGQFNTPRVNHLLIWCNALFHLALFI